MILLPPPEKSHISNNLWIGACPKSIAEFKFVFNMSGKPTYHIAVGQQVTVTPIMDCNLLPDEAMLDLLGYQIAYACTHGLTYVHCEQGINRSALVAAIALNEMGLTGREAIDLIREKRDPICLSNKTFEAYILSLV